MNDEVKFCRDCLHCVGKNPELYLCGASVDIDAEEREYLVQGVRRDPRLEYCAIFRLNSKACGMEGKLWVAK